MRWLLLVCAAALLNYANGQNQVWPLNSSVTDLAVGPGTAVHCQLRNPSGVVTFDDFGPCRVTIDRVTAQHSGVWAMDVIQPDNVLTVRQTFTAQVTPAVSDTKLTVSTSVTQAKPLVDLTCSIASTQAVTGCVFRDPAGKALQARQDVTEGRYSFIESSTVGVQSCGIQINDPITSDLGLWRCDLQTATETHYGHLTVLCPWAMQVPEVAAAVVSVPTLTSQTKDQVVNEGESVTMSCSIQSAIRYCYFRSRNGTIYNARPGMSSSSFEYVGAGLEAGECGVRFPGMAVGDSGTWGCHVGLVSDPAEQLVQFSIQVQEEMSSNQFVEGSELVVEGIVNGHPSLDYCRFVRIDGFGFTSENVPTGYSDGSSLSQGHCKLRVAVPTMLDHHPWTVVAKVVGQNDELARSTDHTIVIPQASNAEKPFWWWYLVAIGVATLALALAAVLTRKRHRRWAAGVRDSFRRNNYPVQEKPPLPA